ncbi:hypothetical protein JCM8097_001134 [Rhodosporidiobolus ruineniae]
MPAPPGSGYDRLPTSPVSSPFRAPTTPRTGSRDSSRSSSFRSAESEETFVLHGEPEKDNDAAATIAAAATATQFRASFGVLHRRLTRYFLVLVVLSALILLRTFSYSSSLPSFLPSVSSPPKPLRLHPTLVGPRPSTAPSGRSLYTACTADELLHALKGAVIRPDGASRVANTTKPESVELKPVRFSFDLPGVGENRLREGEGKSCGIPHLYTQEEACELLGAFGGLFFAADSFGRHIYAALLMILRDRIDGAVIDYATTNDCRGEAAFDDSKRCRNRIARDTLDLPVCGGKANAVWTMIPIASQYLEQFTGWRSKLPREQQMHSPVFISGMGSHFDYDPARLTLNYLPTVSSFLSRTSPVALNLFAGPHGPTDKMNPEYLAVQGPKQVRAYKEAVERSVREMNEAQGETRVERGAGRYIDYFAMCDGADSFDGVHMGFIPNLEKAHILLNLLDLLWADIVAAGGLVEPDSP